MKSLYKMAITFVVITCFCFVGFYMGYIFFSPESAVNKPKLSNDVKAQNNDENIEVSNTKEDKITPSTKMVYEYYYEQDKKTEVLEEEPPYFLLDMTRKELEENFNEWQIISFSSNKVLMRKSIKDKSTQHYIIGQYNGFVAVFYKEEINGSNLKEITDTPISTLPKEEQELLNSGIPIDGNDELLKALQSYES